MPRKALTVVLAAAVAATTLRPAPSAAADTLELLLDRRISAFSGGAGIVVMDPLDERVFYAHDPDEPVITASLYKLAVLLEAERRVDTGALAYQDEIAIEPEDITEDGSFEPSGTVLTIDDALERMITVSDNGAALALVRTLGPEQINATLAASKVDAFRLAERYDEDNAASPRGVAAFFMLLAQRKLVSSAASARMLSRLERQQINDRLPAQLPEGTRVAHKTGNLAGVVHDAGIVYGKGGAPVVVVAMTWNAPEPEAVELIQDVASLVYANAFTPPASAGFLVPRQAVSADTGRHALVSLRVTNLGASPWRLSDADPFRLVWRMRDAGGAVVAQDRDTILLGEVRPGETTELPLLIPVPARPGEYRVTVGLADKAHGDLAPFGVATDTFTIGAHPPFLVALEGALPAILHRGEASPLVLTLRPTTALASKRTLGLGWRLLDARNNRQVARGESPLAVADPDAPVTAFTYLVAPTIRGRYVFEVFAIDAGRPASATLRRAVVIERPRSYGDELPGVAPVAPRVLPTPRPTIPPPRVTVPPLPFAPTRTPAGKTPKP